MTQSATPPPRPEFEHTLRCAKWKYMDCTCGATSRREWYERGFREARDAAANLLTDWPNDERPTRGQLIGAVRALKPKP